MESKMMAERLRGETSVGGDSSVSKRLVRSVSQRLKKKKNHNRGDGEEEEDDEDEDDMRGVSLGCLNLYGRSGGCKVGAADTNEYQFGGRRSSATEEVKGYATSSADCFSYGGGGGVRDIFSKKLNNRSRRRRCGVVEVHKSEQVFLPDDILEMCLMRLPLTTLMTARLVCRKWRNLTTTTRFMQMRRQAGLYQNPWLFLFGLVKPGGYCSGEIHAFDVSFSKWHRINADVLKGRFSFSVATIGEDVYIVGGCSSLTNYGKLDRSSSSSKTHKGVLVFSPLTKSWHKVASMKYARSNPILGTHEVGSDCLIIRNYQQSRQDRRQTFRSRLAGGVSDVYEDPHRLSVRRQYLRNSLDENESSSNTKPYKFVRQKSEHPSSSLCTKRYVLIAVGGVGCWDEALDSGEIYESWSNKWMEIQKMPGDIGVVCSGVVCKGMFYVYSEGDKVAGYDIERGYWVGIETTTLNPPPRVQEYYPKLVSSNGRLMMISVSWCEGDGQIGRRNKAVRKVWELDHLPSSSSSQQQVTWVEVSIHPDAPMDWNAVFVGDRDLIFGVEMFKIFGQLLDFVTICDVSETGGSKWSHISRNQIAHHQLDASSCITKSMAVLHL